MALGFDIWKSVVIGYTTPTNPPINVVGKNLIENNSKVMNAILCSLLEYKFVTMMHCELAKEMWDKLQNMYEDDDKVKEAKLQTHR